MLVAKHAADRGSRQRQAVSHRAVRLGGADDRRKRVHRHLEFLAHLRGPLERRQVHERVPRRVRDVRDEYSSVGRTSGEVVQQPRVDGSEAESLFLRRLGNLGNVFDEPSHFESREVR